MNFRSVVLPKFLVLVVLVSVAFGQLSCSSVDANGHVTVPSGTVSIPANTFNGCTNLRSITLNNDGALTTIGETAFQRTSLATVTIPSSVTTWGSATFQSVTTLTSVTLSEGLTIIGPSAFQGTSLVSVTIPSSVTTWGVAVFMGVTTLTSVTFSEGLISIGESAFQQTSIVSATIPSSVTTLGRNAFSRVTTLTSVTLSERLTSIGESAFQGTSIREIFIFRTVMTIGSLAFSECSQLRTVYIASPASANIASDAFLNTPLLTTVTIPTTFTRNIFAGYIGLTCASTCNCSRGYGGDVAPDGVSTLLTCSPCNPGTYKESVSNSACNSCEAGFFMQAFISGSVSVQDCTPCRPGSFGFGIGTTFCLPCNPGSAQRRDGASLCDSCPIGQFSNSYGATTCIPCESPRSTLTVGSQSCIDTADQIQGLFANEGTPFYVTIFITLIIGGFGVYLERIKKEAPTKLSNPSLLDHFVSFAFYAASLSCEMIIAISILSSSVSSLMPYARLLLVSRLIVQFLPVMLFMFDLKRSNSIFRPFLETDHVFRTSGPFGVLIFLSFFECSLLVYLPWVKSEFTERSNGYPNVFLFRYCLVFKTLQLTLTFVAQLGSLVVTGLSSDAFAIFIWISLAQLAISFVVSVLQGFLKWSMLSAAPLAVLEDKRASISLQKV